MAIDYTISNYPRMFSDPDERVSAKGRCIVLDSEAIGLLPDLRDDDPSSMHVIHCKDFLTDEKFVFFDPYEMRDPDNREMLRAEGEQDGFLLDGIKFINEADVVISQNFVGYDHWAFKKVFPKQYTFNPAQAIGKKSEWYQYGMVSKCMDTMVMSQLLFPDRRPPKEAYQMGVFNVGAHSIEAHGYRMKCHKPENEDWSKLTDHMLHRCDKDVDIGHDMFLWLQDEWDEQAPKNKATGHGIQTAYRCELEVYLDMARQSLRGFRIDIDFGKKIFNELQAHIKHALDYALPHMPMRIEKKKADWSKVKKAADKANTSNKLEEMYECCLHDSTLDVEAFYKQLWRDLIKHERIQKGATIWKIHTNATNKAKNNHKWAAPVTKLYPDCAGSPLDTPNATVAGAFTPIKFEQCSLGNREVVRKVLYTHGWRGVNPTDSEADYIEEHGRAPYHWFGKIDSDSLDRWAETAELGECEPPPEWALDIAKYYVWTHRRGMLINTGDLEYYAQNGRWKKQKNGREQCRGLIAMARDRDGVRFDEYMDKYSVYNEETELWELPFWEKNQWDADCEFRVPADAFAIATNTFRMRHKGVVNIPSRGLYGHEMRKLFIARDGYYILGCDGSGLELRMLAHFMNDPEYTDVILNGDIHTFNQEKAGLPTRDMAKTFIYAFLYGSGIANLALTCGLPEHVMDERVKEFKRMLPALDRLIKKAEKAASKKGYMKAVDGRWGRVRRGHDGKIKVHTVLNVLLQMTGSLCMKYGLVMAVREMNKRGIKWRGVANVHDEMQCEVPISEVKELNYSICKSEWKAEEKRVHIDSQDRYWSAPKIISENEDGSLNVQRRWHEVGEILARQMTAAGELLGIRTPLAGEYMIGTSWADTH